MNDSSIEGQFEGLKPQVRRMQIESGTHQPGQELGLIDSVPRLGVVYHFKTEIEDTLKKFNDREGKFKEPLMEDVVGVLSLYEAAHLGIRGENILDEAMVFTTTKLQLILPKLSPDLAEQVSHALNRPIRKR
ncbi:hypothetical protein GH714_024502 [Hevea brasiliensis]|uniref:Terpene synthase N-terminal domain-containing protein n=1 Tax=Hevea brasiliensis TaxID=3981 RepID=A0A6A6MKG5_HEVBR|nr:hypothetical protein GH714_024502 [Hevea brasiliensis]